MVLQKQNIRNYKSLLSEIKACRIGGLFLALYDNEDTIAYFIDKIRNDLPRNFVFIIDLLPHKIGFPTLFDETFSQLGIRNNIFNVVGIENLNKKQLSDFISYLQYTRERFKSGPYSIIFWVKKETEKQIFNSAPDFYHWIFGTYDFTGCFSYSQTDKSDKSIKEDKLLRSINTYLSNVVYQYENWHSITEAKEEFLIEQMERTNLKRFYIEPFCLNEIGERIKLEKAVDGFIANNEKNFLTLLGDFGTGKSSFAVTYFVKLAKNYLSSPIGNRIPIFISLKDYAKKINIEELITNDFYRKYDINIDFNYFQDLALSGQFFFLIDGFDEMASIASKELTAKNLRELAKLTFENVILLTGDPNKDIYKNKVFLTCRTHYFLEEVQEKKILKSNFTVIYRHYATKKNYEIARINLVEFNKEQIASYIVNSITDDKTSNEIINIISNTYNLAELSSRPLLLEMIIKSITHLDNKKDINVSELYKIYTNLWIYRDDWRAVLSPEGKRQFMWEIAKKMYHKGGDYSIHYTELSKPNKKFVKNSLELEDDDYYRYETTTCSFLNRNKQGGYKFIHKSFMEFFIAEYFFDCLRKNKELHQYEHFNSEIRFFLKNIISTNRNILSSINVSYTEIDLSGIDLENGNLQKANLHRIKLIGTKLKNANLEKANLSESSLLKADLMNANLSGANLSNAFLNQAYLYMANLEDANLSGANLSNASLQGANCIGTNFSNVDLRYTDTLNAKFSKN